MGSLDLADAYLRVRGGTGWRLAAAGVSRVEARRLALADAGVYSGRGCELVVVRSDGRPDCAEDRVAYEVVES